MHLPRFVLPILAFIRFATSESINCIGGASLHPPDCISAGIAVVSQQRGCDGRAWVPSTRSGAMPVRRYGSCCARLSHRGSGTNPFADGLIQGFIRATTTCNRGAMKSGVLVTDDWVNLEFSYEICQIHGLAAADALAEGYETALSINSTKEPVQRDHIAQQVDITEQKGTSITKVDTTAVAQGAYVVQHTGVANPPKVAARHLFRRQGINLCDRSMPISTPVVRTLSVVQVVVMGTEGHWLGNAFTGASQGLGNHMYQSIVANANNIAGMLGTFRHYDGSETFELTAYEVLPGTRIATWEDIVDLVGGWPQMLRVVEEVSRHAESWPADVCEYVVRSITTGVNIVSFVMAKADHS